MFAPAFGVWKTFNKVCFPSGDSWRLLSLGPALVSSHGGGSSFQVSSFHSFMLLMSDCIFEEPPWARHRSRQKSTFLRVQRVARRQNRRQSWWVPWREVACVAGPSRCPLRRLATSCKCCAWQELRRPIAATFRVFVPMNS